MKVSNCCFVKGEVWASAFNKLDYEKAELCPKCGEHCDYIEEAGDLCDQCHKNKAKDLHTCPYSEDVKGDYETKCNCCPDCEHECCMDI